MSRNTNWPAIQHGKVNEADVDARLRERNAVHSGNEPPESADREVARFLLGFVCYLCAAVGLFALMAHGRLPW